MMKGRGYLEQKGYFKNFFKRYSYRLKDQEDEVFESIISKQKVKFKKLDDLKVNHKFRGGLLGIKLSALSTAKSKTVEGLKTVGYKVTTAGSRLLLLVKKLMLLVQVNVVRHNLMLID
ncbi:hypothetical protein Tco_0145640 [Tanacetum coccineum]